MMKDTKKMVNRWLTGLFLALIFGFGIAFWLVPDKDFSAEENRTLQGLPTVTVKGWLDGSVSADLTDYYADQFPLRTAWVGLHSLGELAWGRGESSGVLLGENGQLAVRRFDTYVSRTERAHTDFYRPSHVENGLEAIRRLSASLGREGIPVSVLLAPRTVDVAAADFAYPSTLSDRLDATIRERLGEPIAEASPDGLPSDGLAATGVNSIDLLADFRARHAAGEYIYYRTDHHWTTKGAYLAYVAAMESFGMADEVLPPDFFTVRTVEDFFGTTYSRAGLFFVDPDVLEIWEAADGSDAHYTVTDEGGRMVIESGFINEAHLTEKDKYSAFLDGTHRLLLITDMDAAARGEQRPRLLLARDSFANSMAPFLARHFDIVMVNLSGGMTHLSELARTYNCDRVLIVCNRENLITSDCLAVIS